MNQFIVTNCKNIIIGLLVIIAVLIILLFKSCNNNPPMSINQDIPRENLGDIPRENFAPFLSLLADPKENVHGVLLLAPDRHGKLVLLNKKLATTTHCFSDPNIILTAGKTPVLLPPECLNENIKPQYDKQQILVLTPAIQYGKNRKRSLLFIADLDHTVTCVPDDGMPCKN